MLCNNRGKFVGATVISPEGSVPDLYIYKLTSSLIGYPQQSTPLFNTDSIRQYIIDGKQSNNTTFSLGNQLKSILTNKNTLQAIYDQFCKYNKLYQKNNDAGCGDDKDKFRQFPFHRGDKLMIKLLISGKVEFTTDNPTNIVNTRELFINACDPDYNNTHSAFEYLLSYNAMDIRPTRDVYEITLG